MTGGTVNELGLHRINAMVEQIFDGIRQQSVMEQEFIAENQMKTQIEHIANVAAQNTALFENMTDMITKMKKIKREEEIASQNRNNTVGRTAHAHIPVKNAGSKRGA